MTRKESKLTSAMVTQELDPDLWRVADADKADISVAGFPVMLRKLCDRMAELAPVAACYGIVHDKDTQRLWDEDAGAYREVPKHVHCHIIIHFAKQVATLTQIAKTAGVEPQYVERAKSGKYSWDNMTSYLIHAKDEAKFQYSPSEVETACGVPYRAVWEDRHESWEKSRAYKRAKGVTAEDVVYVRQEILAGRMSKRRMLLDDDLYLIYSENKREIDEAFDLRSQRKIYQAIQAIQSGDYRMQVYYITGQPGAGKSRFVKDLTDDLLARHADDHWERYDAASEHAFDDYAGEEIVVMDDNRSSSMSPADWLKLMDPEHVHKASARYHNKTVVARVLFICSYMPVEVFFNFQLWRTEDHREEMSQFFRRLQAIVKVRAYDPDDPDGQMVEIAGIERRALESVTPHRKGKELVFAPSEDPDMYHRDEAMRIIADSVDPD